MTSYQLNTYSHTRHNATIFIGTLVGVSYLPINAINGHPFNYAMIFLIVVVIIAKLLANWFYKARAIFSVSDLGFSVSWIHNFKIFPEPDYELSFENLQEYVFEPWGEDYRLKVKTKEGKIVKFLFKERKNEEMNFTLFCDHLQQSITLHNNKDNDLSNDLKVGHPFWKSKIAQIAALVITALLIWIWIAVLSGEKKNINPYKLIMASIGGLFLIIRVIYASLHRNLDAHKSQK